MVDCVLYVAVPCSYAIPLLRTYEHRDLLYTQVNEFSYFVRYGEPDMRYSIEYQVMMHREQKIT
jgi:hypothetical protein